MTLTPVGADRLHHGRRAGRPPGRARPWRSGPIVGRVRRRAHRGLAVRRRRLGGRRHRGRHAPHGNHGCGAAAWTRTNWLRRASLLVAASDPTHAVGDGALLLLTHPDQLSTARRSSNGFEPCVDDILRHESPFRMLPPRFSDDVMRLVMSRSHRASCCCRPRRRTATPALPRSGCVRHRAFHARASGFRPWRTPFAWVPNSAGSRRRSPYDSSSNATHGPGWPSMKARSSGDRD